MIPSTSELECYMESIHQISVHLTRLIGLRFNNLIIAILNLYRFAYQQQKAISIEQ